MMLLSEIKKMSTLERLQSMEVLWDALCHEEPEIESPLWHKDILGERKSKMAGGAAEFISLEDVKAGRIDGSKTCSCFKRSGSGYGRRAAFL